MREEANLCGQSERKRNRYRDEPTAAQDLCETKSLCLSEGSGTSLHDIPVWGIAFIGAFWT